MIPLFILSAGVALGYGLAWRDTRRRLRVVRARIESYLVGFGAADARIKWLTRSLPR